jgi:hypothetical protein
MHLDAQNDIRDRPADIYHRKLGGIFRWWRKVRLILPGTSDASTRRFHPGDSKGDTECRDWLARQPPQAAGDSKGQVLCLELPLGWLSWWLSKQFQWVPFLPRPKAACLCLSFTSSSLTTVYLSSSPTTFSLNLAPHIATLNSSPPQHPIPPDTENHTRCSSRITSTMSAEPAYTHPKVDLSKYVCSPLSPHSNHSC